MSKEANVVSEKYLSVVDELTKSEDISLDNQKQMVNALSKLGDYKSDLSKKSAEKEGVDAKIDELTLEK